MQVTFDDDSCLDPQQAAIQEMKLETSKEICRESQVQCQKAIQFIR